VVTETGTVVVTGAVVAAGTLEVDVVVLGSVDVVVLGSVDVSLIATLVVARLVSAADPGSGVSLLHAHTTAATSKATTTTLTWLSALRPAMERGPGVVQGDLSVERCLTENRRHSAGRTVLLSIPDTRLSESFPCSSRPRQGEP